ncbi:flagellar motor protein MotB [Pleionea sp. CnH1-48]|uniref:flagellar motor protein MotB n=1 Tax=Pleionea sp. CnH1-48 TaxID=2954494 RepID=UPI002097DA10|nr:flagellar motor protein MotB [Pleionea sp. CnH1-48]MCO7227428.1 flagellar motor protein MotB [Pleionea sp. CnH1-48]
MEEQQENQKAPIIVRKVIKKGDGHHGGAWKVAFADFATAMMAFFLLLWLMGNTSDEEKQAISGYFVDPAGSTLTPGANNIPIGEGGANQAVIEMVHPEAGEPPKELDEKDIERLAEEQEVKKLEALKDTLENLVETSKAFEAFKEQILIDITPSGLRIQIVDKDKRPMFDSGKADLKFYSRSILYSLAGVLKKVPNQLSITGHTDAIPFDGREGYGNWELSSDRANAARRALIRGGITMDKIFRVEGFADSALFDENNPENPINRRIAIIVLKQSVSDSMKEELGRLVNNK